MEPGGPATESTPPHLQVVPLGHVHAQHDNEYAAASPTHHPPLATHGGTVAGFRQVVAGDAQVSEVAVTQGIVQEVNEFGFLTNERLVVRGKLEREGFISVWRNGRISIPTEMHPYTFDRSQGLASWEEFSLLPCMY